MDYEWKKICIQKYLIIYLTVIDPTNVIQFVNKFTDAMIVNSFIFWDKIWNLVL